MKKVKNKKYIVIILMSCICLILSISSISKKMRVEAQFDAVMSEMTKATKTLIYVTEFNIITSKANANTEAIINHTKSTILAHRKKMENERIVEEFDTTAWVSDVVNYRVGPDTTYEELGELSKYTQINIVGLTNNEWYKALLNEEEVFIHSDYILTEFPITLDEGDKGAYQSYALSLFSEYGWSISELEPLIILWNRESNWNPRAENSSSGAYGIPQSLPASKMASEGDDYLTNYKTQIKWGLKYIYNRYGSPSAALDHSYSVGWY